MNKLLRVTMIAALAAIVFLAAAALAAGTGDPVPGGEGDPLVTLSYLDQVFTAYISDRIGQDVDARTQALRQELEERVSALEEASKDVGAVSASTFRLLELQSGETVVGQRGLELMLRVGEAEVTASVSPGLVDTSAAVTLEDGQRLEKNHMYMVTVPENGVTAREHVLLLVRGEFEIR